ncbi:MAG: MarR family transcriptional regulator [Planctomycetota bacterium]|nr:MarR family transcriptional regulator [Planctomycetota bacterium]
MQRGSDQDRVDQTLAQWEAVRPDLDPSGLAVVLRVQQLAGEFADRLKRILEPAGLAPWEYEVLAALRRSGSLTPTELCAAAQLTSGAMTHRLDRLEQGRLLRRKPSRTDRRSLVVELTAKGQRLVDGILGDRMAAAATTLEDFSEAEVRRLTGYLRRIDTELYEPGE